MFVLFIVAAILALVGFAIGIPLKIADKRSGYDAIGGVVTVWVSAGVALLAGLFLLFSSFFTQDPGEASVLRSWTGEVVGQETTEGLHWKAPWVDPITFDIRNQRVVYTGADPATQGDNSGGGSDGIYITVQDKEGVSANIDIAVRYSINPESIMDIYRNYQNEANLRARLIFNDIRSVVRSVPGQFKTIELLTERDKVQEEIFKRLQARWMDDGIIVEDIALQEIKYGDAVTNAYASAQEAQINVEKEQAKLAAVNVSAQQKVVQAQAEADANAILNASLTDSILKQRYLDTLKELAASGNVVVVPEGFNGLVNVR